MSGRLPGHLFVFEGPDGVGKTTVSTALVEVLSAEGVVAAYASFPGREVAGSLGFLIYTLHHEAHATDPTALQVAHVAAHIDAISQRIKPALEEGKVVILDRFWWSTIVYGMDLGCDMRVIDAAVGAERLSWGAIRPRRVYLLDRPSAPHDLAPDRARSLTATYERLAVESVDDVRRVPNVESVHTVVRELMRDVLAAIEGPDEGGR